MNDFIGKNYTVPQLDLSVKPEDTAEKYAYLYEQTVVDDSESYLGHPDSVLLKNGELYTFTQDYTFSSPSMASSVTLGRNTNGRSIWKDKSGKSLNDLAAESTDCDPQDEKSA